MDFAFDHTTLGALKAFEEPTRPKMSLRSWSKHNTQYPQKAKEELKVTKAQHRHSSQKCLEPGSNKKSS